MDTTYPSMYFPGRMARKPRDGIIVFPNLTTPLGRILFGGTMIGTQGTGLERFRTFSDYAIVLVLGYGRYDDAAGFSARLSPGDVILVVPDHPHRYGPEPGDAWREIFVAFGGAIGDLWRGHGLDQRVPVWPVGKPQRWERRLARLLEPPHDRVSACQHVGDLHALLAGLAALRPENAEPAWLATARLDLGQPGPGLSLTTIARRAGFSGDGFRRAFRRISGETPAAYRRRCRLEAVGRLLTRNDLTLARIAEVTGFVDAFHLSKAWKQATGRSPRQL
jgi:AraC-like DNA-binding protein